MSRKIIADTRFRRALANRRDPWHAGHGRILSIDERDFKPIGHHGPDSGYSALEVLTWPGLSTPGGATGLKIPENLFQNLGPVDGIELEQSVPPSRYQALS